MSELKTKPLTGLRKIICTEHSECDDCGCDNRCCVWDWCNLLEKNIIKLVEGLVPDEINGEDGWNDCIDEIRNRVNKLKGEANESKENEI